MSHDVCGDVCLFYKQCLIVISIADNRKKCTFQTRHMEGGLLFSLTSNSWPRLSLGMHPIYDLRPGMNGSVDNMLIYFVRPARLELQCNGDR